MKKTYEFEVEPYKEYCICVWTKESGWTQELPWTADLMHVKGFCTMLLQGGAIAKIVKRTVFYENYMWGEYGEWLAEKKKEKETLETAAKIVKALLDNKDGEENDQI